MNFLKLTDVFFWGGGGARSSGRDSATGPHDHHGMWYVLK